MKFLDYIILAAILGGLALIVFRMIKRKESGSCHSSCSSCSGCPSRYKNKL